MGLLSCSGADADPGLLDARMMFGGVDSVHWTNFASLQTWVARLISKDDDELESRHSIQSLAPVPDFPLTFWPEVTATLSDAGRSWRKYLNPAAIKIWKIDYSTANGGKLGERHSGHLVICSRFD